MLELSSRISRNGVKGTAIEKSQCRNFGDIFGKADATGAENAALVIQDDLGADRLFLGFFELGFKEERGLLPVLVDIFLKFALAGLVANRAIQGVVLVCYKELQKRDRFCAFTAGRRLRSEYKTSMPGASAWRRDCLTGDFPDLRRAIRIQDRLAFAGPERAFHTRSGHIRQLPATGSLG